MIYVPGAKTAFEERQSLVMGEGHFWYILRVYMGNPLKIADEMRRREVSAYCPIEEKRRQHPKGKQVFIDRKALFGGYVFSPKLFPAEMLNGTRTKVGWLTYDDAEGRPKICYLTQRQMADVRRMEQFQADQLRAFLEVMDTIARAVRKLLRARKFVRIEEFRNMSQSKELAA